MRPGSSRPLFASTPPPNASMSALALVSPACCWLISCHRATGLSWIPVSVGAILLGRQLWRPASGHVWTLFTPMLAISSPRVAEDGGSTSWWLGCSPGFPRPLSVASHCCGSVGAWWCHVRGTRCPRGSRPIWVVSAGCFLTHGWWTRVCTPAWRASRVSRTGSRGGPPHAAGNRSRAEAFRVSRETLPHRLSDTRINWRRVLVTFDAFRKY